MSASRGLCFLQIQFLSSYRGAGDVPLGGKKWITRWQKHFLALTFFYLDSCGVAWDSHKKKTFYFGVLISEMALMEKTKQVFR